MNQKQQKQKSTEADMKRHQELTAKDYKITMLMHLKKQVSRKIKTILNILKRTDVILGRKII